MLRLLAPDDLSLAKLLGHCKTSSLSYREVGATRDGLAPGYTHDINRVQLGAGEVTFRAAKLAIARWKPFPAAYTNIYPKDCPIKPGRDLVLTARSMGVYFLNPCRIVYAIDEPRRFGFGYGTLPGHVAYGEERFLVEWLDDDSVWYDLRAFSKPGWLMLLGYPLARRQQKQFGQDSKAAMVEAVTQLRGAG
jgi:uncharacterized protein (UPF0548 family)